MNPLDRGFREAREGGVTTVLTGPGSANPIAGQFAALKTDGRWVDEMVVKAPIAMKFALGENPKSVYNDRKETPVTRMATAAIIRRRRIPTRTCPTTTPSWRPWPPWSPAPCPPTSTLTGPTTSPPPCASAGSSA